MNYEIYNPEQDKCRLLIRTEITDSAASHIPNADYLDIIRRKQSQALADKIFKEPKFFSIVEHKYTKSVYADVVVLTPDELQAELRQAYNKGRQDGMYTQNIQF